MRKSRLVYWVCYTVVLTILTMILVQVNREDEILLTYCVQEQQERFQTRIEETFPLKVQFVTDKQEAQVILTDSITQQESSNYQRIAFTPLTVAVSSNSKNQKWYQELGYLSENKNTFYFDKLVEDAVAGNFTEKVYCPKENTVKGDLFYDFLLITVNQGRYPKEGEEMQKAKEKVDCFLALPYVIRVDTGEWVQNKRSLDKEICLIFEADVSEFANEDDCNICYPEITVLYQLWYKDKVAERNLIDKEFWEFSYRKQLCVYDYYRLDGLVTDSDWQKEFSYVEVPLED